MTNVFMKTIYVKSHNKQTGFVFGKVSEGGTAQGYFYFTRFVNFR